MAVQIGNLLTRNDAARKVGVTVRTLERWVAEGLWGVYLVPTRVGGRVYFTEDALNQFLAETTLQRDRDLAVAAQRPTRARIERTRKVLRAQGVKV